MKHSTEGQKNNPPLPKKECHSSLWTIHWERLFACMHRHYILSIHFHTVLSVRIRPWQQTSYTHN